MSVAGSSVSTVQPGAVVFQERSCRGEVGVVGQRRGSVDWVWAAGRGRRSAARATTSHTRRGCAVGRPRAGSAGSASRRRRWRPTRPSTGSSCRWCGFPARTPPHVSPPPSLQRAGPARAATSKHFPNIRVRTVEQAVVAPRTCSRPGGGGYSPGVRVPSIRTARNALGSRRSNTRIVGAISGLDQGRIDAMVRHARSGDHQGDVAVGGRVAAMCGDLLHPAGVDDSWLGDAQQVGGLGCRRSSPGPGCPRPLRCKSS